MEKEKEMIWERGGWLSQLQQSEKARRGPKVALRRGQMYSLEDKRLQKIFVGVAENANDAPATQPRRRPKATNFFCLGG